MNKTKTDAKQEKKLKQKISELNTKIKNKIKEIKAQAKIKKQALKNASNTGWNSSLRDYPTLPDMKGAKNKAVSGYKKGMNASEKAKKAVNKLKEKKVK